jgi:DinB superfamily
MTTATYAAQIAAIARLPDQLEALVAELGPEDLTTPFLAGEWTVAQNVHHLFDSHANSYIRCKLILTEEHPPLKPYRQDDWAALPDASSAEIAVSLTLLRALHARWVQFWEALPDEAWARAGLHAVNGPVTLAQIVQIYADHGEAHLDQIRRTLAAR